MLHWLFERFKHRKKQQRYADRIGHSLPAKPLRIEQLEDRRMLTAVSWIGSATGNWGVAANWSNDALPTSAADVSINTTSLATITIQAGEIESIDSLVVGSNDSLLIAGGSLTTALGLTNSGTINVSAGSNLTVNGGIQPNFHRHAVDARRRLNGEPGDQPRHEFRFRIPGRHQQHDRADRLEHV